VDEYLWACNIQAIVVSLDASSDPESRQASLVQADFSPPPDTNRELQEFFEEKKEADFVNTLRNYIRGLPEDVIRQASATNSFWLKARTILGQQSL
jgi:hypothetical protein